MAGCAWILLLAIGAEPTVREDAAVVRPMTWSPAIQLWKQYRLGQGIRVHEIDAELGTEEVAKSVRQLAQSPDTNLRYILLAGDVATDVLPASKSRVGLVPTWYQKSTVMARFGSEPHIATDNPYGDLNGDHDPELAVGRIPADNPKQLAAILERTIRYEQSADYSRWRRNVHVVAGVGGFGMMADSVIEMTTRRFLTDRLPGWAEVSMTHACPGSPFCPDPWRFSQSAIGRLNEGGAFWIYLGHGHVQTLDRVQVDDELLDIITNRHVPEVKCGDCPPITVFFACYTGAFDATEDSLAEQLIKCPTGPVATLAASRMTGPYGMSMLASGMLSACYEHQHPRLGEIVRSAKREMLRQDSAPNPSSADKMKAPDPQLQLINSLASALSPEGHDLRQERLEHVWEMNLLGDPMLRLSHPMPLRLATEQRIQPGDALVVSGIAPIQGRLRVELAYRRDAVQGGLNPAKSFSSDESVRNEMQRCYMQANDRVLTFVDKFVAVEEFRCTLGTPPDLPPGRYSVRAFLEGAQGWAAGDSTVTIRKTNSPTK